LNSTDSRFVIPTEARTRSRGRGIPFITNAIRVSVVRTGVPPVPPLRFRQNWSVIL